MWYVIGVYILLIGNVDAIILRNSKLQSKGNDFITVNPWYRGLKSFPIIED